MPRWGKKAARSTEEVQVSDESGQLRNFNEKSCAAQGSQQLRYFEKGRSFDIVLHHDAPLLPSKQSDEASEFKSLMRLMWLRQSGWTRRDAAKKLGQSETWVSQCWNTSADRLQHPRDIPPYIAEYERKMLRNKVEPFRPAELRRGYMSSCTGLYQECVSSFPWEQAVMRKRNYGTGVVTKTDIEASRQDCTFPQLRTGISRIDLALEKIREDFHITDPGAYLTCNWYPDGSTNIASHQHDFWSAILSFGASRIFFLDDQPLLLSEGDLLVFGTQKHSVPKMLDVEEGRVSVCIFWYPERRAANGGSFVLSADSDLARAAVADPRIAAAAAASALGFNVEGVVERGSAEMLGDMSPMTEERLMAVAIAESLKEHDCPEEDEETEMSEEDSLLEAALAQSLLEQ